MKLQELFEFNWAIGANKSHAQSPNRQNGNLIVWLNANEVLPLVDPDFRVTPSDKTNHIGDRMNKASAHFVDGGWMDPPDIGYSEHNKKFPISIGNGRHRIAASLKAGKEWFPANVTPEDIPKLKKIISVKQ